MLMEHGTSHQQIKYGHNDCICGQHPQRVTGYIAYMYIYSTMHPNRNYIWCIMLNDLGNYIYIAVAIMIMILSSTCMHMHEYMIYLYIYQYVWHAP